VAWLITTARNKAIDQLRRRVMAEGKRDEIAALAAPEEDTPVPLDSLRLLFTCCHPALAPEARVALTLRTIGGLTTEEIAPFLVRRHAGNGSCAPRKIRAAAIPYRVPDEAELEERLAGVLRTIYLVFNEGYSATTGERLLRVDLCREAIRLARLLVALLPGRSEAIGLLALCLLTDARRGARVDRRGDLVRLAEQDRSAWDRTQILEGLGMADESLRLAAEPGPLALQAAIAACHARAPRAEDTDWRAIVALYDRLALCEPTPIVRLNRAVAVAEAAGPERALPLVDGLLAEGGLEHYHLLHAARGELLARLGRSEEAVRAFEQAVALAATGPERRFLASRIAALSGPRRG
jgi:RNA polymerase sigma-70 factor (ECF subfamily)